MSRWIMMSVLILITQNLWAEPVGNDIRDPTTPLNYTVVSGAQGDDELELELHSVLISERRRLAIINGDTVLEGQSIPDSNGIKVQRILPQKVVLQQGDRTWALTLSPNVVKRH